MKHRAMLKTVGARVRALREDRRLSRRELSEKSGVSERFLAQLEVGEGNISLVRFADVALALGTTPAELLSGANASDGRLVALLGVRGAGKSTVGERFALARELPFLELDQEIERVAGLSLAEIFEVHGEAYYRRLEREVLAHLLSNSIPAVIATGGSIVTHFDNFSLLKSKACTVWLRARPEDHWNRVIEQGDSRPMGENPHAFSELRALMAAREPLYSSANFVIDTSSQSVDEVVQQMVDELPEARV